MGISAINTPELFAKRLTISDGVLFQDIVGESVMLHINSGEYFGLNDIGTVMWKTVVNDDGTVGDAFKRIRENYPGVEPTTLRSDLTKLVEELLEEGLLKIVEA